MLLVSMLALLFVFSLIGMEIGWAIGFAAFGYLVLAQFEPFGTPMILFSLVYLVLAVVVARVLRRQMRSTP